MEVYTGDTNPFVYYIVGYKDRDACLRSYGMVMKLYLKEVMTTPETQQSISEIVVYH